MVGSEYRKDIRQWTIEFAVLTIELTKELKRNNIDYDLISQLRRSGTSVGANVTEAKASSSRKELTRFYEISLRSANETKYWLEIINKGYNYDSETMVKLKSELEQIEKVIGKIIVNLKKTN